MKFYNMILRLVQPLVEVIGKLHFPYTMKKITGRDYYKWRDDIHIGTVFLTYTYGELSNLINPTDIKHGAIYIGKIDGVGCVLESLGSGSQITDLVTFLTTKDEVVGLAPLFLNDSDRKNLSIEARKLEGIKYDYFFNIGRKALYCFETVIEAYHTIKPEMRFKVREIVKGKYIYDPSTFLTDHEKFKIIFDSRS